MRCQPIAYPTAPLLLVPELAGISASSASRGHAPTHMPYLPPKCTQDIALSPHLYRRSASTIHPDRASDAAIVLQRSPSACLADYDWQHPVQHPEHSHAGSAAPAATSLQARSLAAVLWAYMLAPLATSPAASIAHSQHARQGTGPMCSSCLPAHLPDTCQPMPALHKALCGVRRVCVCQSGQTEPMATNTSC